jgi:hypothetical protein
MVNQHCGGLQKEQKMANVHRLYRLEQVLPQGRFSLVRIDQIIDAELVAT